MAEKMRYNKIIDLLEQGKPVFSTSTVPKLEFARFVTL